MQDQNYQIGAMIVTGITLTTALIAILLAKYSSSSSSSSSSTSTSGNRHIDSPHRWWEWMLWGSSTRPTEWTICISLYVIYPSIFLSVYLSLSISLSIYLVSSVYHHHHHSLCCICNSSLPNRDNIITVESPLTLYLYTSWISKYLQLYWSFFLMYLPPIIHCVLLPTNIWVKKSSLFW